MISANNSLFHQNLNGCENYAILTSDMMNNNDNQLIESFRNKLSIGYVCNHVKGEMLSQPYEYYFGQDENGDTQLHNCIQEKYTHAVWFLINIARSPVDLDLQNRNKLTALHLAVLTHQPNLVRHLVIAGASQDIRTETGNTALHLACKFGAYECARALVEPLSPMERSMVSPGTQILQPNLEHRNWEGATCFHLATIHNNVDILRLLVYCGANVEAQEGLGGRTALHLAIQHKKIKALEVLLMECKPNLNAQMFDHTTPYQMACKVDRDIAEILKNWGADSTPESESESDDSSDESDANFDDSDYSME